MSVRPGLAITQFDMAALATLANSKTMLPKYKIPGNSGSGNQNYAFPDWTPGFEGNIWQYSTAYRVGTIVIDNAGNCQQCTTAGTSSSSTVVFASTIGATTNDNTVVWTCIVNPNPKWLTELNRLRGNLSHVNITSWAGLVPQETSGPWPVTGPTDNFSATNFYYPDTGSQESVSVVSNGTYSYGTFSTAVATNTTTAENYGDGLWQWSNAGNPSTYPDPMWTVGTVVGGNYIAGKFTSGLWVVYTGRPANPSPVVAFADLISTHNEWTMVVGGGPGDKVTLNGNIVMLGYIDQVGSTVVQHTHYLTTYPTTTTPDPTDPLSLFTISGNMPGVMTVAITNSVGVPTTGGRYIKINFACNNLPVLPGRYTLKIDTTFNSDTKDTQTTEYTRAGLITDYPYIVGYPQQDSTTYDQVITTTKYTRVNFCTIPGGSSPSILDCLGISTAITYNTSTNVPGIHNSLAVKCINLPGLEVGFGAGIYCNQASRLATGGPVWNVTPYPQPTFQPENFSIVHFQAGANRAGIGITTSVAGFWTACTSWVNNLNVAGQIGRSVMPWNYVCTKDKTGGGTFQENPMLLGNAASYPASGPRNSYTQTTFVEQQVNPPGWLASTPFTVGFTIMDLNGNFQRCTTAGTSWIGGALTTPIWSKTLGATTTDNTVVWTCVKVVVAADTWASLAFHNVGDVVVDSNGNTQTQVSGWQASHAYASTTLINDANNNSQQCTTAGTSGTTEPAWSTTFGGTTTDGSAVWTNVGSGTIAQSGVSEPAWATTLGGRTVDSLATWKCTKLCKRIIPAVARQCCVPRYPFYWLGNTSLGTTWVHNTSYALNATVIDSHGYTQQCTTAGTSGSTAPAWSSVLGGTTTDGSAVWKVILLSSELAWLKPPTTASESEKTIWGCGNQWQRNLFNNNFPFHDTGWQQDNMAYGWWIYSISLNRTKFETYDPALTGIGQVGFGAGSTTPGIGGSPQEVQVTIGCIRNGAFVAFGTYRTGHTYQVLWPIFTTDALVYQCSERIDLQAVAIGTGNNGASNGVSTGATVSGYPICAAYVSDVTNLLNLII